MDSLRAALRQRKATPSAIAQGAKAEGAWKSAKDRLLNIARGEGRAFDVLLVGFALERLLYRLSVSAHCDRFLLKGGMLITALVVDENRVTRDADFLGHDQPSLFDGKLYSAPRSGLT